jgi:hypothetical protein
MGQAVGIAAALCAAGGIAPRKLDAGAVQRALIARGADLTSP